MSDSPTSAPASAGTKRGPAENFSGTAWVTMLAQSGVEHWHGASPKQGMTHISLNVNTEKGIEYLAGPPAFLP